MASPETPLPAVRACIFDMDGLLINSEDMITLSTSELLAHYGRPPFAGPIRARLMGVPDSTGSDAFHAWARLPVPRAQFARELKAAMRAHFPRCEPLPGAEALVARLRDASSVSSSSEAGQRRRPVRLALASTTKTDTYRLKVSRPATRRLLDLIPPARRVLGDDARVPPGRAKPAPDIYRVALAALNSHDDDDDDDEEAEPIRPCECLVFEDSVAGVEAARRAGMRVVWVPHPDVAAEYADRVAEVLAGRTGLFHVDGGNGEEADGRPPAGVLDDGWAECIKSLEDFDFAKYGIEVAS